jgi:hypothetical protein
LQYLCLNYFYTYFYLHLKLDKNSRFGLLFYKTLTDVTTTTIFATQLILPSRRWQHPILKEIRTRFLKYRGGLIAPGGPIAPVSPTRAQSVLFLFVVQEKYYFQ